MKKKILTIFILLALFCTSKAQTGINGLYLNIADFKAGKITEPVDCASGKSAIRVSNFFLSPYVFIRQQNEKIRIPINQVYAFENCDDQIYRIWNEKAYLLRDSSYFNIYEYTSWQTVKVWTSRMTRVRQKQMTNYFISINDSSPIIPLSLTNLLNTVGENSNAGRLIADQFADDKSLLQREGDTFHLNQILIEKSTD
ncbi:hypothetical protein [Mangrovibacterium diazotrophicum]|uniref:Uncharacterized protein n=1 Tax=Mangrovibacterium diazotrophicum TaxID=1261403 RepID=A0A419W8Q8_9BACT|nr:hypothetical protein [Mangrovibacterium diazotrophicum]RKD91829.1 hypothetical protein BC643_2197 [Mangrovibacterium diazotrophicum]